MHLINYIFGEAYLKYKLKNNVKNITAALHSFGIDKSAAGFYISEGTGFPTMPPEEAFRMEFYQLTICTNGKACITVNTQEFELAPNDLFVTTPGTIIKIIQYSPNFTGKLLAFEKSFLLKNILDARQLEQLGFLNYGATPVIPLNKDEAYFLKAQLQYINDRNEKTAIFKDRIMQSLIFNLLFETAEIHFKYRNHNSRNQISREDELFIQMIKLIDFHHLQQKETSFYANLLHISDKYLIQICKKASGKTPGQLIAEANIAKAKLLLKNPDHNISTVSNILQYSSVAAFSKFFKKQTSMAPTEWKNET